MHTTKEKNELLKSCHLMNDNLATEFGSEILLYAKFLCIYIAKTLNIIYTHLTFLLKVPHLKLSEYLHGLILKRRWSKNLPQLYGYHAKQPTNHKFQKQANQCHPNFAS